MRVGMMQNMETEGPPLQHTMDFEDCNGVMIQQDTNMCCRFCCCHPNVNFRMQGYTDNYTAGTDIEPWWYIWEDAGYLGRCLSCWCPGARQTTWTVRQGLAPDAPVLMTHEKSMTCSHCPCVCINDSGELVRCPCCCFLPYLITRDAHGQVLGQTKYLCNVPFCFVPKFDVVNADDVPVYHVRPDTCCCGCCVRCRCRQPGGGRARRFRIPYVIRSPTEPHEPLEDAAISDLWAGVIREACTKREVYGVKFPPSTTSGMKQVLVGTTLLVNTLMHEHD